MEEKRPFKEKSPAPTASTLEKTLGKTFPFYEALLKAAGKCKPEWNHSRTSGWMLKVHDGKKALFYLIPLENAFRVNLTVRETEKAALLKERSLAGLHEDLQQAQKAPEGYVMRFLLSDQKGAEAAIGFVREVVKLRG